MRLAAELTDQAVMVELGRRVAQSRLGRNQTQGGLGEAAGVSRRTVQRLESGESVQLQSFIRVLRALGELEAMGALLPEVGPSPMQLLELMRQQRRRARPTGSPAATEVWTWGDETGAAAGSAPGPAPEGIPPAGGS
jgi:transcriptional regulator with XRE-family HTH domain